MYEKVLADVPLNDSETALLLANIRKMEANECFQSLYHAFLCKNASYVNIVKWSFQTNWIKSNDERAPTAITWHKHTAQTTTNDIVTTIL